LAVQVEVCQGRVYYDPENGNVIEYCDPGAVPCENEEQCLNGIGTQAVQAPLLVAGKICWCQ
jgi:hypothetical protein